MATSGTTTFTLDVDEIIDEAYSRCGGEPVTGYEVKAARRSLNLLLQEMVNRGLFLWNLSQSSFVTADGSLAYVADADTVDVKDVFRRVISGSSTSDTELVRMSRAEYALLPNKGSSGTPVQFYVERAGLTAPTVYLWPVPGSATVTIHYWKMERLEDVTKSTENIQVPVRWLEAVCAGLAHKLSIKRSETPPQLRQELFLLAERAFIEAAGEERERDVGTFLVPG